MQNKFGPNLLELLARVPRLEGYRNSRPVLTIAGQPLLVEDVVKAGIVANIPVLLISGTGDAKTMLAKEIVASWFGGQATVLRGDGGEPPMKAFLRTNFERLFQREAKSDEELIEATQRLSWSLVFIDEINRGIIGTLQNDMLAVVDGEIAYRGRTFKIGDGFSPVIAAMNLGDEYTAAQALDDALLRRFPIVLNLDRFCPTLEDYALIDSSPARPCEQSSLADIKDAHRALARIGTLPRTGFKLASLYLFEHWNRCAATGKQKREIVKRIPQLCESWQCPHIERHCHRVRSIPPATLVNLERVVLALEAVAQAKARRVGGAAVDSIEQEVHDYLECVRVFLPLWNKVLLDDNGEKTADEYADDLLAPVVGSFDGIRNEILEIVGGKRDLAEVDLGDWTPVMSSLLDANLIPIRLVS
jgi:uncharacterized membrane protein YuzA (DUF378 family)